MVVSQKIPLLLTFTAVFAVPLSSLAHPDLNMFTPNLFPAAPDRADCVLEDGTEAACHEMTVFCLPQDLGIGPLCPKALQHVDRLVTTATAGNPGITQEELRAVLPPWPGQ